jgi:hypothetical protein
MWLATLNRKFHKKKRSNGHTIADSETETARGSKFESSPSSAADLHNLANSEQALI